MFLLTAITSLNNKLVAYDFMTESGLAETAKDTGLTDGIFANGITSGIGIIIAAILSLLGVIFLALIIYAGITWMTSGGDETKVEKAQKIITQSVIGLIIVLAAYAISVFVINILAPK